MHNPKNELEFVEVNNTNHALSAGYVPVRAVELSEFISSLKDENARLAAENTRLQSEQARQVVTAPPSYTPSQAQLEAQRRAQVAAEKAARRQQMIQSWLMLQNMNRPYVLPQPPMLPQPPQRPSVNCTTTSLGGTAYTNCN
jgi:hypothetical protein